MEKYFPKFDLSKQLKPILKTYTMKKYLLLLLLLSLSLWGKGQNAPLDSIYQLAQEYLSQQDSFLYGQTLYKIWDGNPHRLSSEEIEVVKQKTFAFGVDYGFHPAEVKQLLEEGRYEKKEIELYYQLQVLEEVDPAWSYEKVKGMEFAFNASYPDLRPDTVHWMKIKLHGPQDTSATYLFQIGSRWRSWERSDIYYERGDSIIHQRLGYSLSPNEKLSTGFNSYFEVDLSARETIELYVRIEGASACFQANQLQLYYLAGKGIEDSPYYSSDGQFPSPSTLGFRYKECSQYLTLLSDPLGDLNLEQAKAQLRRAPNIVNGAHTFSSESVYWGRMLLLGSDSFWGEQLFQLGASQVGAFAKIDVYYQGTDGSLIHLKTGSSRPFFQKPIPHQINFVEIKLPPNDTLEVLFRFEQKNRYFQSREGRQFVPVYVGHIGQAYEELNLPWIIFRKGIVLGGLGLIAAYFLLFFLIERSRLYLYFFLLVLGFLGTFWVQGLMAMDTGNADWGLTRSGVFFLMVFVGIYLFTVEYLNLKKLQIRLRYVLLGILLLLVVFSVLQIQLTFGAVFLSWLNTLLGPLLFLFGITCLILGIIALRKGHRPAIFYLLAFSGFLIFLVFLFIYELAGSIQELELAALTSGMEITTLAIPLLFALGMGYRSRLQRKERAAAITAEEIAKVQAAAAQEASETKSNFLSTVSHELRTPLTSIIGFAQLNKRRLEEKLFPLIPDTDKKAAKVMQRVSQNEAIIVQEGQRLAELINDLLDLAKIESGKVEWNIQDISPSELIARAEETSQGLFTERTELSLVSEVSPRLPTFQGDFDRLLQVLLNLISNAVKFTESGTVSLLVQQNAESQLQFAVRDTGAGIPAEYQDKIFQRFQQIEDQQAGKPKGTGLGLPICKEIVEFHGGRIWVESPADFSQKTSVGSTFYFTLPLGKQNHT